MSARLDTGNTSATANSHSIHFYLFFFLLVVPDAVFTCHFKILLPITRVNSCFYLLCVTVAVPAIRHLRQHNRYKCGIYLRCNLNTKIMESNICSVSAA